MRKGIGQGIYQQHMAA